MLTYLNPMANAHLPLSAFAKLKMGLVPEREPGGHDLQAHPACDCSAIVRQRNYRPVEDTFPGHLLAAPASSQARRLYCQFGLIFHYEPGPSPIDESPRGQPTCGRKISRRSLSSYRAG